MIWKVGIIGAGYWSDKHLKAWSRIPNVEIMAICDLSPEKLIQKANLYGLPESRLFQDVQNMLEHADLDFLDIITGPDTHLELIRLIASYGKPMMCQKPFARSIEEAEAIIAIVEKANVRLMITENWRWLTPYRMIKDILEEGRLGVIQVARFYSSTFFTPRMQPHLYNAQPFLTEMPRLMLFETGVHWFDMWRYLFGEPNRLYCEAMRFSKYVKGEDSAIVTLGYDDFYGVMDLSWITRREFRDSMKDNTNIRGEHAEHFIIDGDKGTLKMFGEGTMVIVDNDGSETMVADHTDLNQEESHFRLQSHFIHCLETGDSFQTSAEDNLKTLKLTFAAYESASEHKAISLVRSGES